jgi:phosphate transport system protein
MNDMTGGHTVRAYNKELSHLNDLVRQLGELGRDQLHRAVQSLREADTKSAGDVIDRDRDLNDLDVQADEEVLQLIAKRQPMGKDLRDILTVAKVVSELERVGDEARKVANLTIHFYDQDKNPPNAQMLLDIYKMADFVDCMLRKSLEGFRELDLKKSLDVIKEDDNLYEEYRAALRRLSTYVMEDSRNVGAMVDVTLTLRALERIGGHAKNIAGHVIFLMTARDVRHESLETIRQEILTGDFSS